MGTQNPNLQRLLADLNGTTYHPSTQNMPAGSSPANLDLQSAIPGLTLLSSQPPLLPAPAPTPSLPTQPVWARTATPPSLNHSRPTTPGTAIESRQNNSTPTPDPSTVTTWPAALKHVTRHLITNEAAAAKIRQLIKHQHDHEKQWWEGREALIARQNGRTGTSQQVSALLKSLGGKDIAVTPNSPETNQAELDAYDKKVYAGLMNMTADFDRKLRGLGVPFYAIKYELVTLEVKRGKEEAPKGKIDKGELRELQKRMLQTLEDLLSEDD